MIITPFQIAQRFVGVKELPGDADNPFILSMLRLDASWPASDEIAWCSAYVNYVCWLLRLPRSKSLAARSWLDVGMPIALKDAKPDADIVVLSRGLDPKAGHVGFYAGQDAVWVSLLGGNQANAVGLAAFERIRVLGVRRLVQEG